MKEFKCGQVVYLMINNAPNQTKVLAVNTLERLQGKNDTVTIREYFVEGVEGKVDISCLFNSLNELLDNFRTNAVPASSGTAKASLEGGKK